MLAQICGVLWLSNWVQAKACGGALAGVCVAGGGERCAPVAVGVALPLVAVAALLLHAASTATRRSSGESNSQGTRDDEGEVRMRPPRCLPARKRGSSAAAWAGAWHRLPSSVAGGSKRRCG